MANLSKSKTIVNVGVDVGKFFLDVYIHEKNIYFQVSNDADGIKFILKRISYYRVSRVVMESTGRYEFDLAQACYQKQLPVVIAKPSSVRQYAKAIDQLAKTDQIDAKLIAQYAAIIQPKPTLQKSKNLIIIKGLLTRRRQLMQMRTQELNRVKIMGKSLELSCKRIIKCLDKEIERVESKLQKHVELQQEWHDRQKLLQSVPGVGNTLIYSILADLPEIGTLNSKQVGKLVGVAPMNRDSGLFKGKRRIQGGRAEIRTTLYMATLSATLCNPLIRAFYKKLVLMGKHKKVAITACMRKMITILNAMVRDNKAWCID
ncbi:IS110 family transposase [Sessilibacter corallicola]|uniref:IS110 family transposase n=1 Tax=Sessilibacter corallicola TaxID=2904075 RepID=UPI001E4C3FFE|nr:IS110 family transposase [Sessilibacter corallicola]MCE2029450.1 IS110 family transposase [Sessilibacter corallicola]